MDTVSYENLEVGKSYVMKGILMDKGSKKPLRIKGKPVQAECTFIPQEECGTITLAFSFDAAGLAGKELVVFECVYLKGTLIAKHTDINDKGQTVTIKENRRSLRNQINRRSRTRRRKFRNRRQNRAMQMDCFDRTCPVGYAAIYGNTQKKQEESAEEKQE